MSGVFASPTHAYVPGKTSRHPEGCFDDIRNTASTEMTPDELAQSDAFLAGLQYLQTGYFWEAHEVLEPVWMALPESGEHRHLVQALIQFVNAQLKLEMGRPKAAKRLCGIVRVLLSGVQESVVMGVEIHVVLRQLDSLEEVSERAL